VIHAAILCKAVGQRLSVDLDTGLLHHP
jgi:hypothetical protein